MSRTIIFRFHSRTKQEVLKEKFFSYVGMWRGLPTKEMEAIIIRMRRESAQHILKNLDLEMISPAL